MRKLVHTKISIKVKIFWRHPTAFRPHYDVILTAFWWRLAVFNSILYLAALWWRCPHFFVVSYSIVQGTGATTAPLIVQFLLTYTVLSRIAHVIGNSPLKLQTCEISSGNSWCKDTLVLKFQSHLTIFYHLSAFMFRTGLLIHFHLNEGWSSHFCTTPVMLA